MAPYHRFAVVLAPPTFERCGLRTPFLCSEMGASRFFRRRIYNGCVSSCIDPFRACPLSPEDQRICAYFFDADASETFCHLMKNLSHHCRVSKKPRRLLCECGFAICIWRHKTKCTLIHSNAIDTRLLAKVLDIFSFHELASAGCSWTKKFPVSICRRYI